MSSSSVILAIGTEVTSGQIINRNAAWIAQRLEELGIPSLTHIAVPDDHSLIQNALNSAAKLLEQHSSSLLFVTGGLGPTTDDFTRDAISNWLGQPLEFHEDSWTQIQKLFEARGLPVSPNNRQQCFYPKGAHVLPNSAGTANGFEMAIPGLRIWVLPGPPKEIEAIWKDHIENSLIGLVPPEDHLELHTWQCLGQGESWLAEKVEAALEGSQLAHGYRVHMPYVEIKIWCKPAQLPAAQPYFDKLEKALGTFLVKRGGGTLRDNFVAQVLAHLQEHPTQNFHIVDLMTKGLLAQKILEYCHRLDADISRIHFHQAAPTNLENLKKVDTVFTLEAGSPGSGSATVFLHCPQHPDRKKVLQSQYINTNVNNRLRAYSIEIAFQVAAHWLAGGRE